MEHQSQELMRVLRLTCEEVLRTRIYRPSAKAQPCKEAEPSGRGATGIVVTPHTSVLLFLGDSAEEGRVTDINQS